MLGFDILVITALCAFVLGLVVGVVISRPTIYR